MTKEKVQFKPLRIAIVDDEPLICDCISHYISLWEPDHTVQKFHSAEGFSFDWETRSAQEDFDIIFLDIDMPGANGMTLAKQIRKNNALMSIVFVTASSDYVFEGYDVSALNYLLKPISQEQIFQCLDKAKALGLDRQKMSQLERRDRLNQHLQKVSAALLVEIEGLSERILLKNILFIEAQKHFVHIVTTDTQRTYRPKVAFKEVLAQVESLCQETAMTFIQNHRSYVVNLSHVVAIGKGELRLINGTSLPVSRQQHAHVHRAFIAYHKDKMKHEVPYDI